jgi:hypothetical protein
MDGSTKTILALLIFVGIGAFVVFALFPRRRSPKGEGSAADNTYSDYAAGAGNPDSHHTGDGGGHAS